jgi:tRNA (cytidine56-2'-O)-methyltransferase
MTKAPRLHKQWKILVLRWGHRPERDKRITTHICLVARAFGADKIVISDIRDKGIEKNIGEVTKRWGGPFEIESGIAWRSIIKDWKNKGREIVHLTMYGLPIDLVINKIKQSKKDKLIIVGAEKVPKEFFDIADYNVAITNQPHSEVAALAIFLDRLLEGEEMRIEFSDAVLRVVPSKKGKLVMKLSK